MSTSCGKRAIVKIVPPSVSLYFNSRYTMLHSLRGDTSARDYLSSVSFSVALSSECTGSNHVEKSRQRETRESLIDGSDA